MSRFDNVISTKMSQLNEIAAIPDATAQQGQQPQQQQGQQPQQQQISPEQTLSKVFQTLKFNDPNTTVKSLNNALKGAGNVPGIKEFFTGLAFDPQKGFLYTQQQTKQPTQNNQTDQSNQSGQPVQ